MAILTSISIPQLGQFRRLVELDRRDGWENLAVPGGQYCLDTFVMGRPHFARWSI